MTATKVIRGKEAKEKLKAGVDTLVDAVKVTLGAKGRNVVIARKGNYPHVTKDGVTVARSVMPLDLVEKAGADMVRQAANQTAQLAGDGTSTSSVLAQYIISYGLKAIDKGANPTSVKSGIEKMVKFITDAIKSMAIDVSDKNVLSSVAIISANGDKEIGEMVADVVYRVGKDGEVKIAESQDHTTYSDIIDGMVVESGYMSPYFSNNKKMEAEYENPLIFCIDFELKNMDSMLPLLESILSEYKNNARPFVIFCRDAIGEFLSTMVMNKHQRGLPVVVVKSPGFGNSITEYLMDIAIMTGATLISDDFGVNVKNATYNDAGTCDKIVIDQYKSVIIGGQTNQDAFEKRKEQIKAEIEKAPNESIKVQLKKRLSAMSSGIGIIYVGGLSDVEVKEKKDRFDDAVCAAKASLEEGVVAGAGMAYLEAIERMEVQQFEDSSELEGANVVQNAIKMPFYWICTNAGKKPDEILRNTNTSPYPFGYDVKLDRYCNLIESGIIDPAKVTRVALENAASVAAALLTCEAVVVEDEGGEQ